MSNQSRSQRRITELNNELNAIRQAITNIHLHQLAFLKILEDKQIATKQLFIDTCVAMTKEVQDQMAKQKESNVTKETL